MYVYKLFINVQICMFIVYLLNLNMYVLKNFHCMYITPPLYSNITYVKMEL
jgi:hypothetical protein